MSVNSSDFFVKVRRNVQCYLPFEGSDVFDESVDKFERISGVIVAEEILKVAIVISF